MTCARTQGFLAKRRIATVSETDARKAPLAGDAALAVVTDVDEIYATKGKKVVHLDLRRSTPPKAELEALLLGPTGNLRAPTIRTGRTLIVGFDDATYTKLLD
jgi:arsenate reductase-like glutaredoxin family protein